MTHVAFVQMIWRDVESARVHQSAWPAVICTILLLVVLSASSVWAHSPLAFSVRVAQYVHFAHHNTIWREEAVTTVLTQWRGVSSVLVAQIVWNVHKIATSSTQPIVPVLAARSFTPTVSTVIKVGVSSVHRDFSSMEDPALNVLLLVLPAKIQPIVTPA